MGTPAPPPPPPRVLYPLSADLIHAADALPSNLGRSRRVHSLIYHLGLLDLPGVGAAGEQGEDGGEGDEEEDDGNEERRLLRLLAGEAGAGAGAGPGPGPGRSRPPGAGAGGGNLNRAEVIYPPPALEAQLQSYHVPAYIEALLGVDGGGSGDGGEENGANQAEKFGLVDDCPPFPLLAPHITHIAGASIFAAQALAAGQADIAIAWDGGRHHAHKGRAAGFCYVNDAVLAILELRKPRKVKVDVQVQVPVAAAVAAPDGSVQQSGPGFGARPEEIRSTSTNTRKRPSDLPDSSAPPHPHGNGNGPASPPPRVAAAAKKRTVLKRLERILYLDLDLHWGDGVEEAFRGSGASVLTCSLHCHAPGFYPPAPGLPPGDSEGGAGGGGGVRGGAGHGTARGGGTTDPFALSLPLHPGLSPRTFLAVWTSCVLPLLRAYSPEAIVLQLGLDGLAGDPMAQWNLDLRAILGAVRSVLAYARDPAQRGTGAEGGEPKGVKVLLLGGGGYDSPNAARGWAAITALALGRLDVDVEGGVENGDVDVTVNRDGGGGSHGGQSPGAGADADESAQDGDVQDVDMRCGDGDGGTDTDADAGAGAGPAPPSSQPTPHPETKDQSGLGPVPAPAPAHAVAADRLSLHSPIPYHPFWPEYSPNFTLDVPSGQMPDPLHTPSYLARLQAHVLSRLPAIRGQRPPSP